MAHFVVYFAFGVLYSTCFTLLGGNYGYYLARLAGVHTILLGVVIGLLGYAMRAIMSAKKANLTLGLLMALHFGWWLVNFSAASTNPLIVTGLIASVAGTGFVAALVYLEPLMKSSSWKGWALALIGLGVICLKIFILPMVPAKFLSDNFIVQRIPREDNQVKRIFYPLSQPLDRSISYYSVLLPELDPTKSGIIFVLDALRKDFVGKQIGGESATPTLDRLKENNFFSDRYYVQGSWTRPSTASLFTGLYPHTHGVCLFPKGEGQRLPLEYRTLAERMAAKGFYTIGSSFTSHLNHRMQFNQGFKFWLSPEVGAQWDYKALQTILFKLIRKTPEKLFLYVHLKGPHSPYQRSKDNAKFWKRTDIYNNGTLNLQNWTLPHPTDFKRGLFDRWMEEHPSETISGQEIKLLRYFYAAELNFYDRIHLRRFVQSLESLDIYDRSLMAVTGDHGEDLFDAGFNPNGIKRRFGHVQNLRDLVISPPLVVKFPNSYPNYGSKLNNIYESIDLNASFLEFAGATRSGVDGRSFLKRSFKDRNEKEFNSALSEKCNFRFSNRRTQQKAKLSEMSREELRRGTLITASAYVEDKHKLNYNFLNKSGQLYHILKDPREQDPLSDKSLKSRLTEEMKLLMGSTVPEIQRKPGKILSIGKEQQENLRGLGYF